MSTESQTYKECRSFAIARHDLISQLTAGDDATAKVWSLALTSAMLGLEEQWFSIDREAASATVWIGNQIGCWDFSAKTLLDSLHGVASIKLVIDSCGGDSSCALELFRGLAGRVVEATITGKCFSAAVTLAMSAQQIKVEQSARLMVHLPRLCRMGTASDLRDSANFLDRTTGEIAQIISERTKQPLEVVNKWFDGPDKYFSASESVKAGLADELYATPTAPGFSVCFTGPVGSAFDDGKTPAERQLWRLVRKLGEFEVSDPQKLRHEMLAYLTFKTRKAVKINPQP